VLGHSEDPTGARDAGAHHVDEPDSLERNKGRFRAREEGRKGKEEDQQTKF